MNNGDILLLDLHNLDLRNTSWSGLRLLVWANSSNDQSNYDEGDYSGAPQVAF